MPAERRFMYPKPVHIGPSIPVDTALRVLDQVLDMSEVYGPQPDLENVGMIITLGALGLLVRDTSDGYTIEDVDNEQTKV